MKKLHYYILWLIGIGVFGTSCSDFLEQKSLSDIPADEFMSDPTNAQAVLASAYDAWTYPMIHSNGLFYELSVCSSDAERHPEKYEAQTRHIPENLYYGGTSGFDINFAKNGYSNAYDIIAICNKLITNYEALDVYQEWMKEGATPTTLSNIYGQAITLRATCYYELCRYFGDVPLQTTSLFVDTVLTNRDYIYEYNIEKLKSVVPIMFRVGEAGEDAIIMTRTYAEGLIGRLSLFAGGYATRRTDMGPDFYRDLDGNTITYEQMGAANNGGVYNRRTDYLDFYRTAKKYLEDCVANSGTVELVSSDPRGSINDGYGNPFQYVFQQMLDLRVSSESVYEIPVEQGSATNSERPYAFGRPSGGGGSNAFPCKSYGQSRMQPTYYYGDLDPEDLRRDVTVAVTASVGNGRETLISLEPGSKTNGGLANNKWDENRMNPPYYQKQRKAGVNNPYMRMSDVVLMLAEVYAELGEEGTAKEMLKRVRSRAFPASAQTEKVDNYISGLSGETLKDAILTERKLEFAGEGLRKWDMIRTGKLPDMIKTLKTNLTNMINGIESNGYYQFSNGNEIPAYVWTKEVDAKAEIGHRLTTQCTDETNPVLFPGWRGQYNDWENVGGAGIGAKYNDDYNTNTAIKGLFSHIVPGSSEALALEADGYEMKKWGQWYVEYRDEYSTYVFRGFEDGKAPIYMVPLPAVTISTSNGSITNGYGFDQQ
ncbi:RagB/SusD family nutrient uptake outer membrane protein [Saccharicrinis sp. FJH2]|uniref:RagB/SusD family nutrient uptake outer membrane protein n=1 Tax=Saccharicrinis sp. FJH65 TaxID=3344659 RepID=UPI0035F2D224